MSRRTPLSDSARMYVASVPGFVVAGVVAFVLPWATDERVLSYSNVALAYLLYWPVATAVFLVWSYLVYSRAAEDDLRIMVRAESVTRRKWWYFLVGSGGAASWTITGAVFSVGLTAAAAQLPQVRDSALFVGLAFVTVAAAWALMVFGFAMSYHQLALAEPDKEHFEFQVREKPAFDDYLTLACLLSVMGATSPAEMRTSRAWRLVRTNVLLAFAFNSVIVAMVVSIIVSGLTS